MSRRLRPVARVAAAAAAGALAAVAGATPAVAAGPPGPTVAYTNSVQCVDTLAVPSAIANGVSWGQRALEYTQAWQFATGAGVRIAVIDTGVNPVPAFGKRLVGLADLVVQQQPLGLHDCDGHGTLVAGIIGASPDTSSGFAGVAPDATILSIRQSSENYAPADQQSQVKTAGDVGTLATAIRYAADQQAQVINISEANCKSAAAADSTALTAAVDYAVGKGAVVVAAAGNLEQSGDCSKQNTPGQPAVTAAAPADVPSPGLLAVGAMAKDGTPASFSLAGPWVNIAAPGTEIISTNPHPSGTGQVSTITTSNGTGGIQGTSFAAPYVSGVVALIRQRHPELTPAQVVSLIERTAAHPAATGGRNDYVGYGLVDPVAALTAPLPAASDTATNPAALPTVHPNEPSGTPRRVALWGVFGVAVALAALFLARQTVRSRRRPRYAGAATVTISRASSVKGRRSQSP